jgi:hypothetical protein
LVSFYESVIEIWRPLHTSGLRSADEHRRAMTEVAGSPGRWCEKEVNGGRSAGRAGDVLDRLNGGGRLRRVGHGVQRLVG